MATPVTLPPIATDTTDGTLVRWLVAVGDAVEEGQVVAEVDTAKVVFEVESPAAGVVIGLLVPEGEDVRVGETLAWLGEPGEATPAAADGAAREAPAAEPPPARAREEVRAAPVVRRLAARLGVELSELTGTGPAGRVMREDVERAAAGDERPAGGGGAPGGGRVARDDGPPAPPDPLGR